MELLVENRVDGGVCVMAEGLLCESLSLVALEHLHSV